MRHGIAPAQCGAKERSTDFDGNPQHPEDRMLKLLIAVDGSECAQRAIEAAGRLAGETKEVRAVLVNARKAPGYYGEFPPYDFQSVDARQRLAQDALLEAATAKARQVGLKEVSVRGVSGEAAKEIAAVAGEIHANAIVMGTRGLNALGGMLVGSVAQRVVHAASVPVLLVK
jgi:nucleotide-binding universal stress UspA family protein